MRDSGRQALHATAILKSSLGASGEMASARTGAGLPTSEGRFMHASLRDETPGRELGLGALRGT